MLQKALFARNMIRLAANRALYKLSTLSTPYRRRSDTLDSQADSPSSWQDVLEV